MGFGAATSGAGLTAIQVAAALRMAAAMQLERHRAAPKVVRRTKSGVREGFHDTADDAYTREEELRETVDGVEIVVTEYAPEVFKFIRSVEGIDEEWFTSEWTLPEERLKMELGAGRSQALFLKSNTMEFMCKTIAIDEVNVLMTVLKQYADHLTENPSSLLMRFYMLLKIVAGNEIGYILCFNDVFGNATALHEKWDIKGRIPKPGKYLQFPHLIRRAFEPDPYLIDTPREGDTEAASGNANEVVVQEKDIQTLETRKDKDLTRLFWLEHSTRQRLIDQLMKDYEFLGSAGLMDYSLLIGVRYNDSKVSRSGKRYVVIRNMKARPKKTSPTEVELRPSGAERRHPGEGLNEFIAGVHSLFDQEIYYIGIIDMLTFYSAKKKVANFFKSFLWQQRALSTIPPDQYKKRIESFTTIIFPEVD